MCIWAQRHMSITIIWPKYPQLFAPFKNDKGSKVGSSGFFPPLPSWKVNLRRRERSRRCNTTETKAEKWEKSYCFKHTKPLCRLVVELPQVLGAPFFTVVDARCYVPPNTHTHTRSHSFLKIRVIIRRNSKPPLKVSRPGELWGQGWRQIS